MIVGDWYSTTAKALLDLWGGFISFIPKLIGALIIFIIGWFISIGVGKLVAQLLRRIKFNRIFEKGSMKTALEKAEIKVDASGFIGAIFKWVLMIVFLLAAVEVLGLIQFADFLTEVLKYLPNVVIAALIFAVAVIIADILEKVIRAAVEGVKVGYGNISGVIVKWSIWIFAILAILYQLQIAKELVQVLFTGIIALIAIAGGLAFGLGGKELAANILQSIKRKFQG